MRQGKGLGVREGGGGGSGGIRGGGRHRWGGVWKGNGRGRTGGGAMTGRPTRDSGTNNHEGSLIHLRYRRMRVNWEKIGRYTRSLPHTGTFSRGDTCIDSTSALLPKAGIVARLKCYMRTYSCSDLAPLQNLDESLVTGFYQTGGGRGLAVTSNKTVDTSTRLYIYIL